MSIHRVKPEDRAEGSYVEEIRQDVVSDDRISYVALGILCYLLSHPDGWDAGLVELGADRTHESQEEIRRALAELERYGYDDPAEISR